MSNSIYLYPPLQQVTLMIVDETSCFEVSVPGRTEAEGIDFLELIGSGMLGSGLHMTRFGQTVPPIRMQYERRLKALEKQIGHMQAKVDDGRMSKEQYARWLYQKRRDIAYVQRSQQGLGAVALLEARDWAKYGAGGRSWNNIYGRAAAKAKIERRRGYAKSPIDIITQNAPEPNKKISDASIHGAKFLKKAGPVFIVLGTALDAQTIYSAPEGERAYVAGRVGSEAAGGFIGGGTAVSLCLVFGVVPSGWGLLACGAVGGLGGSYAGSRPYNGR